RRITPSRREAGRHLQLVVAKQTALDEILLLADQSLSSGHARVLLQTHRGVSRGPVPKMVPACCGERAPFDATYDRTSAERIGPCRAHPAHNRGDRSLLWILERLGLRRRSPLSRRQRRGPPAVDRLRNLA